MKTIEFKKELKTLYSPKPDRPEIIIMPRMQFAMVDGEGEPNNSQKFQDAIGALYSIVYSLKFGRKKAGKMPDFTIGALEGLWWTESGKKIDKAHPEDWRWTLMIWLPDFIEHKEFEATVKELLIKKPNPALAKIRLDSFEEGRSVQIMHIGPYAEEQPDIDKMLAYAAKQGFRADGMHHEVYLGDPRRAKPEKLKTILRQPISSTYL